jgi:hypothetical protein
MSIAQQLAGSAAGPWLEARGGAVALHCVAVRMAASGEEECSGGASIRS